MATTKTTETSKKGFIEELFQFLRIPGLGRRLFINNKKFSSLGGCNRMNNDSPVKCLKFEWGNNEYRNHIANDPFQSKVIWESPNLEELELRKFPFESFTQAETERNEPNKNNSNNNNNNNGNDSDNTNLSTKTTTPISIGNLSKTLKKLKIDCRKEHFHLPPDIGMLINLTELKLDCGYCSSHLPLEIGDLQSLQTFELSACNLQSLPAEIGNLLNLKVLDLRYCNHLERLPKEVGKLKNLQKLSIVHCHSLEIYLSLHSEIGNLLNLMVLNFDHCRSLLRLQKEIGKLKSLQELNILDCNSLEQLPIELNQLCGNLQKLRICNNKCLQTTEFLFQIGHFTKLRELEIDWEGYMKRGNVATSLLRSLPDSLVKIVLRFFSDGDLGSISPTHQQLPTTSEITTSMLKLSSLLGLLPLNIEELHIDSRTKIAKNNKNQHVILTFLQKFPRLSIHSNTSKTQSMDLQNEESLGLFTKESLYLMFFNRSGRALTKNLSLVGQTKGKHPFPLSMWPMVLGDVPKWIGKMENKESEQIMEASVIFAFLQEVPALLDRTVPAATVACPLDDNTIITTETAIRPSETTSNLKRPYPFYDDCKNKK